MFKASLYSFDYEINHIDTMENDYTKFYNENKWFSKNHLWKTIIFKLKKGVTYEDKFIFHLQLNYQNEFKKNIISNKSFSDESSLDSNHSVLEDIFLIYCFRGIPYQLWDRKTANRMQWIMVAIHTWKSNLISHAINLIEYNIFKGNIKNTKPLLKNATPLKNAIKYVSSIEIRWLLDRDKRKTWISFIATREMLEASNTDFIERLAEEVQNFMGDLCWEIKYKASVFWRKINMWYENSQLILNSFPEILSLTEYQKKEMKEFTDKFNGINSFDYVNDLNKITDSILKNTDNN